MPQLSTRPGDLVSPRLLDASMFWSGGPDSGVRRVISTKRDWLLAQGWQHTLLAPGASGHDTLDCGGVPIPFSGGYRFPLARRHAARLMAQAQPDVIEAADPYVLGWACLDAAARLRVPAVAFCHSDLPALAARLAGGAAGVRRPLGRFAWRSARDYLVRLYDGFDLVLAPSASMTRQLHDWGLRHAVHQPLGVDARVFTPGAYDPLWRTQLERKLDVPGGTRLLLYAGRFAPEKHLDVLAAAVQRLGPGHLLLAVGHGPRPPVGTRVRVLPPEPDMRRLARLMASCDVFVHAGDQETFGLSVLEAMACGTPVVVQDAAGLADLAQGVGLTVRSRRADAWADVLRAALDDRESPRVALALERARQHHWPVVLEQWARRYRHAMRVRAGQSRVGADQDRDTEAAAQ